MNVTTALPRVAPVTARHALCYADLASEELDGVGTRRRRRAAAALNRHRKALRAVLAARE